MLLSLAIWVPIAAGLLALIAGERNSRWVALAGAIAGFLVTLPLYTGFDLQTAGFQFVERMAWIPQFNIHYHAGNAIAYPVRKNAREVRSSYVPHKARGYCMMWANPRAQPVALEYSFVVGAAPHPK